MSNNISDESDGIDMTVIQMLSEISDGIDQLDRVRYHVHYLEKGEMLMPHIDALIPRIDALDTDLHKACEYGKSILDGYGKNDDKVGI